jgi:hypothetical protein
LLPDLAPPGPICEKSRFQDVKLTGSGLDLEPETEVTKLRMARRT